MRCIEKSQRQCILNIILQKLSFQTKYALNIKFLKIYIISPTLNFGNYKSLIAHQKKKTFLCIPLSRVLPPISSKYNIKYAVKISALPRNLSRLEFQTLPVTIYYGMTFSET